MPTAIAFRFPGGRYHATPWDAQVNEAEVEWPPSPWRILRALVATWHRKADRGRYPEPMLEALIEALASGPPVYRLPPASRAHSRHYMPAPVAKTLVFDAFAHVDPEVDLVALWPELTLASPERELLAELLRDLGYLGRAESWVAAWLLDEWDGEANCEPMHWSGGQPAAETREGVGGPARTAASQYAPGAPLVDAADAPGAAPDAESTAPDSAAAVPHATEPVTLVAPSSPEEYRRWRLEMIEELGLNKRRLTARERRLLETLPERFLDAVRVETADVRAAEWNRPPGAEFLTYRRPADAFRLQPQPRIRVRDQNLTTARMALARKSQPLPRIEDAVRIGELMRVAAISHAQRIVGDGPLPHEITGHDLRPGATHGHAFYMPEDIDGDGRIDHVLVHAPGGLSRTALQALGRIGRLWDRDGNEWQAVLESYGQSPGAVRSTYGGAGRIWVSVTPYLHPWHAKKRFGVQEQVARECRERGLPEVIALDFLPAIRVRARERRPVHFHRFRSKRGLVQPDTKGQFLRVTFAEEVHGPLALGFGCHYGLGMFRKATGLA